MQPRSLPPLPPPFPHRFRTLGCLAALALMVGCAQSAPLTFRWSPEVSRAEPYDAQAFHGETFTLAATPLQYGRPLTGLTDAGAKLYWQTPGMEPTQWYTAPGAYDPATGTLTATWTPAMDVGGDRVTFFFALTQGDAVAYRVYGRLRLAASPGFNPAELVPEDVRQELIDAITADVKGWADATYQPKGDYLTAEADPTVPAWAKADAKPAYDWTEILNRPATFPPATHNHDAAYLRLNQNRAGTTNQLSGAILTMHRRDDKQYPIFMLGSQVSNGLMKSDRWVASLYYDRIEFLSDAGTEPRVLAFGADTADAIVRKAELDEAMMGYLPLSGGTVTGETTIMGTSFSNKGWLFASNISEGGTWIASKYAAKAHTHTQGDVEGLTAALAAKQDTLTAGEGISIEGNVISATGGDPAELPIDTAWPDAPADDRVPSTQLLDEELTARLAKKQNTIGASTQLSLMNLTASGTVAAKTLTQGGTALDDLYYSKTSGQATQTLAQQAQTNAAKAISDAASAKNAASAADTKAGTALTSAQAAQTTAEAAMPKSGGTFTGGLNVMGTVTAAALAEGGQALADKYAAKAHTHAQSDVTGLTAALAAKQDALTAGEGISISGNVISSTGGGDMEVSAYEGLFYIQGKDGAGDCQIVLEDDLLDGTVHLFSNRRHTGEWEEVTESIMNTRLVTKDYVDEAVASAGGASVDFGFVVDVSRRFVGISHNHQPQAWNMTFPTDDKGIVVLGATFDRGESEERTLATVEYVDEAVASAGGGGGWDPTTVESVGVGISASAGPSAVAVGPYATATVYGTSLGFSASAADAAVALGDAANAGSQAVAIGYQASAKDGEIDIHAGGNGAGTHTRLSVTAQGLVIQIGTETVTLSMEKLKTLAQ